MKKKLMIIGIITVLFVICFSGCFTQNNQVDDTLVAEKTKFIGTWQNVTRNITRTIILYSNNSCSLSLINETGTWDIQGEKLVMKFPDRQITYVFYYTFSNNDKRLSLSSAVSTTITQVFTKQ